TCLVLGGAGVFGAFPLAYAVIIDALSIPLTLMLIGLIFRGVAFVFRFQATPSHRPFWDRAFFGGSLLGTFSQGVVVGAVINGFTVSGRAFSGGMFDWLTPFSLFCGLGLCVAYALLGATWLVMKSEGALQQRMRELTRKVLLALMVVIAAVSVWTPLGWRYVAERWFTLPNFFWFLPVPILVLALSLWIWRLSARPASHARPFILTLGLIFLGFSGLGISVWPNIIPPNISLWDAAAPPSSQVFMLPGALLIIPVILMYTAWSYYVFRGKVSGSEGYH
ncbi:cytochrome d ubiquinol oxidase subunit II, partial [Proteus terrae]